ncbi:cold shock domain-containing protein [Streptomyces sp. G-G2]|uniref:cold shock domain-containing protein n=1 Tax=Streptomyces sp. G-G2 TaxID=3046201 RepID=UPI0024B9B6DA|nr:cold shock domain-containing protein [Streptomyces sp. G-G2]MDJ0382091.1 cold shock domain-containing protein [Streptomyces sp. G-G2]
MTQRVKGFVQSYNRENGYGFLVPYGAQDPLYVERDDIESDPQTLSEDQQVTFSIDFSRGRFVARQVRP